MSVNIEAYSNANEEHDKQPDNAHDDCCGQKPHAPYPPHGGKCVYCNHLGTITIERFH